jgi:pyruvate dehydrogenase E1 component beta subunit
MGEDVGAFGGPLRSTAGLFEEFGPDRVRDMPMSESAIVGAAVGAALQGKRPVVDLMFLEFLGLIMQQLFDAGAMHYYSGGAVSVPMVVRGKYGVGPHHGHQYDLHSWAVNTPGIKVVAPATPSDAKGLMRAAIRDPNPVLFLEHMALYHAGREEVSEDPDFLVPLGTARVARKGADVSIFASAMMVKQALRAAGALEAEGIDAEVVDLRTLAPLDADTILASVRKTGRAVVACEAIRTGGSANDVSALVAEQAFDVLRAPVRRVVPPPMPVPFHRALEGRYLPGADEIADAARALHDSGAARRLAE